MIKFTQQKSFFEDILINIIISKDKQMEKQFEKIKQINTNIENFQVKLTLLDQAIKLSLRNSYTQECFEGHYTFDQFSDPVKNNFQSVSEIYEEIQNIVNQKNTPNIEIADERLQIDENNNFIFKYGVFKKNKVQFRPQTLETKKVAILSTKEGQASVQIQELIKKNAQLQKTLQNILVRLQFVENTLQIYQKKQQKIESQEIIKNVQEISKSLQKNHLQLKLQNNQRIVCRIENQQGSEFESIIKKSDIPEEIVFLYAQIPDLYKEFAHILNKQNKKIEGNKITIDQNFNIQLQIQFQRAGQKLAKRGVFKTKSVQINRLQRIQKRIRLNDKKQNQLTLNIQESLFKKVNKVNEDSQKLKAELGNLGNKFTQKFNSIQKSLETLVKETGKAYNKYFDANHPNFDLFQVTNNRIILNSTQHSTCYILSPIRISQSFTTYSYKIIKSSQNRIIFGLGNRKLKEHTSLVKTNFIGYVSNEKYLVHQQNNNNCTVNKGDISVGDEIKIQVNLNAKKVTWFKNGAQLISSTISDELAKKCLYPTLAMYNIGDTVEMNF